MQPDSLTYLILRIRNLQFYKHPTLLVFLLFSIVRPAYTNPNPQSIPTAGDTFTMSVYEVAPTRILAAYAIREHILAKHGITVDFKVLPSKRMPVSVLDGDVDSMSVSENTEYEKNKFLHSEYPSHVYNVLIYYKTNSQWEPSWPPNDAFKNAKGATKNYTAFNSQGFDLTQIAHFRSGPLMVNAGRADYWLDALYPIPPDVSSNIKPEIEGYHHQFLYPNPVKLVFADTVRGRFFKEILDNGTIELLKDPKRFREVYFNGISDDSYIAPYLQKNLDDYLNYMTAAYPTLIE